MAAQGHKIPALKKKAVPTEETDRLLKILASLDNFGGNLLDYCEYHGINNPCERQYLDEMMTFIKRCLNARTDSGT
jgi:hypothetical protein